ncbi:alpha/beta-hydrolase [Ophiobolus disseminans]|uniref:Carboxylic ester hydrolase n=1 Tax=Ophiobolus disseminans TaxID=1469910 RepID=A0A6A7A229_9PLEO|nr:alpha/beta-hydrolase [Ophiobolus disseminans]
MYLCLFLTSMIFNRNVLAEPFAVLPDSQVAYHGTSVGSVKHFQNIKFAKNTSGARRFAPPVPFSPPSGSKIDASAPGSACPQTAAAMPPFFSETKQMSEDCLNLRIARPCGTTPASRLPVVVWLHGGGVVKGSAYDPHFEPDKMIKLSQELKFPTIYVALNYRLTIFGFARTPLLKDQASLNVGIRDQRAGLQWIKDNIEYFGGDSDRITVFGLSAGGTFASLHLMAYGGEQGVPFNRVWAMSGPPGTALNMSSTVTEMHTKAVAQTIGCDQIEDVEMLQCLRDVPMPVLLENAMQYSVANHPPAGLFTFIPSVDDDMFPARPSALYKTGRFVKGIPIVFGWTQDDGAMNAGPAYLTKDEDAMKSAIKNFASALNDKDFDKLFSLYTAADFESRMRSYELTKDEGDPIVPVHYFRLSQILRDMLFTCSSIDFGYEMRKHSLARGREDSGVRLYALNQSMLTPLWKGAGMPYVGVSHGSDTNYIYNGLFSEGPISANDQALSKTVTEAFVRFAATGDPNSPQPNEKDTWPEAFRILGDEEDQAAPQSLSVEIVGGPLGTGPSFSSFEHEVTDNVDREGAAQQRSKVFSQEKLLERCSFINSLSEKLGV